MKTAGQKAAETVFREVIGSLEAHARKASRPPAILRLAAEEVVAFWLAMGWTYSNGRKWAWTVNSTLFEAALFKLGKDHRDTAAIIARAQDRRGLLVLEAVRTRLDPTSKLEGVSRNATVNVH